MYTGRIAQFNAVREPFELREVTLDDIGMRSPTLDEVFLGLTGQSIEGDGPVRAPAPSPAAG